MKRQLPIIMLSTLALLAAALIGVSTRVIAAGSVSVRGTVKLDGPAPKAMPIPMIGDPTCAKEHPSPLMSEDVVTDGKGGLENVVVFVSEGLPEQTSAAPSEPAVLEQKGCTYKPHVVAMRAGQTLRVINSDHTTHNIHPMPANNREWNKSQPPGLTIEETFARAEVAILVKCNVHPWMRGYVAVFKHPYFAVTGSDGGFDIKDLPAGSYTLQAWHEKLGTSTQKITVGGSESKPVEFVFKAKPGM